MTQSPQPSHSANLSASLTVLADELERQSFPPSALYVVATPIGNIADISVRALKILSLVDGVGCEDTRNTAQLFSRYGLSKSLFAAHQHNEREVTAKIIQRLQAGERIALVSDAGTPGISDPGARIVDAVLDAGLRVIPVAGASAAIAALSVGGLVSDQFHFAGFLPAKAKQRESVLTALVTVAATLVFYEAPHRIVETITALAQAFGPERRIVFGREISKLFEQIHRCPLSEAGAWIAADTNRQRGEFVLLVEGAPVSSADESLEAQRILTILLEECSVSQAAALTARITGQKKNALYELALQLSQTEK
jgi:16S rRNA (cytidine1402-2'-O)-methyltransferase